jgi:hypothetical protein
LGSYCSNRFATTNTTAKPNSSNHLRSWLGVAPAEAVAEAAAETLVFAADDAERSPVSAASRSSSSRLISSCYNPREQCGWVQCQRAGRKANLHKRIVEIDSKLLKGLALLLCGRRNVQQPPPLPHGSVLAI